MRRLFESLQKSDGDGIQTAPLVIAWCVCPTFTLLGTSRQNAKVNGQPLRLDNKTCIIRKNLKTYRHLGIETAGPKCFGQVWGVNYCCRVVIRSVSFPRKSSPHLATTIPYPYPVQVLYNGRTNRERRESDCFRAISGSDIQPSRGYINPSSPSSGPSSVSVWIATWETHISSSRETRRHYPCCLLGHLQPTCLSRAP